MTHQVNIPACIAWNRVKLSRALIDRNSQVSATALKACRDAQRYANNIATLEKQL